MAVKIRLTRLGDKKSPFYRVVVADSRTSRDGKVIEKLGTYDTKKDPAEVNIDVEKAKDWLSKGAQPTETAKTVLVKAGVLEANTKKTAPKSDKKKKA
ncbi:MAG: 30S ribosomal protein S16 [Eubacteriales bacterium]|nr:30S ribosomal protein S16 [Eubacteriales bacterium]